MVFIVEAPLQFLQIILSIDITEIIKTINFKAIFINKRILKATKERERERHGQVLKETKSILPFL